ncbi:MAG: flagellar motor switch protein FliM [Porcipelethomonas sp.]
MADVLSQSQIDELLKNLNNAGTQELEDVSEKLSEKKVVPYNFKAPKKFTKEHMKSINKMYETYARLFSSYLISLTRFFCKVEILQIEEQRYYEFSNALPEHTLMGNIELTFDEKDDIMDTMCIIQISNAVSFSLLERLMGGPGHAQDLSRNFTDIEIRLMEDVFKKMGSQLKEVFAPYLNLYPNLQSIETNARVNQPISADESIILATLEVEYNDVKSIITIAVPSMTMESMISKVDSKNTTTAPRDSERELAHREGIIRKISRSNFKLEAVLAETGVSLDEILSIRKGDVLMLNTPIEQNVLLKVNNETLFDGKLGTVRRRKAIKICNVYKVRR